ncbi:DUF6457 domain-containing protein [Frankia gtarii]|uniref:DUF6457 domain-containing protein n=1 Tax=Frankia gtarii TaxID=2950102 RepID=UPI0021C0941F|nr:DUF6457 domain-containing protein [Frankia gtarii]
MTPAHTPQPGENSQPASTPPPAGDGDVVDRWVAQVSAELRLAMAGVDVAALLDLTREVAHGVARPAAPLTAFLVGFAAGREAAAGGTDEAAAVRAATEAVLGLLARRAGGTAQPIRPGPASSR